MKLKHERYDLYQLNMFDVFEYSIKTKYMVFLFEFNLDKSIRNLWVATSGHNLGDYEKSAFYRKLNLSKEEVYKKIQDFGIKPYITNYVEKEVD